MDRSCRRCGAIRVALKRPDFIEAVARRAGLPGEDAERVLDAAVDEIARAMAAGATVHIAGFGTFGVRTVAGKRGRCPASGEPLWRPSRRAPHFRPVQALDALLDA